MAVSNHGKLPNILSHYELKGHEDKCNIIITFQTMD
jgi:hypothetical protein